MSRTISISTTVFASIWANRKDGEETEDAILSRILECAHTNTEDDGAIFSDGTGGVNDRRNGVYFPEGFEVIRNYKRREYRAVASNGSWIREDSGQKFSTLNQVNTSIAAGSENIWNGNWKYQDTTGALRSINELRR